MGQKLILIIVDRMSFVLWCGRGEDEAYLSGAGTFVFCAWLSDAAVGDCAGIQEGSAFQRNADP